MAAIALRKQGVRCGHKRVARLMRQAKIRPKTKGRFRPTTTDSKHNLPVAPNLLNQNFKAATPNKLWLTDIPYVPLAGVIDLYS